MTARSQEDGFVAGAEALIFGVLVFVIGTLIVVNAWSVVDAKFAASAAAREAARAVVESATGPEHLEVARVAARRTLDGYGRPAAPMTVTSVGPSELVTSGPGPAGFRRCTEVGYEVEIRVPAVAFIGSRTIGEFRVSSQHHELIDPYRSGRPLDAGRGELEQGATCAW